MSSSAYDQPLRLSIEPSVCLKRVRRAAHVAAGIGLVVTAQRADTPWNYVLWGCMGVLVLSHLYVEKTIHRWTALVWIPNGEIRLFHSGPDGESTMELDEGSFVSPWLIVLTLRSGTRRIRVPICWDAVGPDEHRRLRVLLRQGRECEP